MTVFRSTNLTFVSERERSSLHLKASAVLHSSASSFLRVYGASFRAKSDEITEFLGVLGFICSFFSIDSSLFFWKSNVVYNGIAGRKGILGRKDRRTGTIGKESPVVKDRRFRRAKRVSQNVEDMKYPNLAEEISN